MKENKNAHSASYEETRDKLQRKIDKLDKIRKTTKSEVRRYLCTEEYYIHLTLLEFLKQAYDKTRNSAAHD